MRELPPKPYPEDRELEALFRSGVQVPHGRRPAPETERLIHMIFTLRDRVLTLDEEVRMLRQDCQVLQRRLDKSEQAPELERGRARLDKAAQRSLDKAKRWLQSQGFVGDPSKVDGFEVLLGAMEKHRHSDDDAVELLRRYRED